MGWICIISLEAFFIFFFFFDKSNNLHGNATCSFVEQISQPTSSKNWPFLFSMANHMLELLNLKTYI